MAPVAGSSGAAPFEQWASWRGVLAPPRARQLARGDALVKPVRLRYIIQVHVSEFTPCPLMPASKSSTRQPLKPR